MKYDAFLASKAQMGSRDGFRPTFMPSCLKDFQVQLTEWAVEIGRGALFEDCGLGKTLQQLVWAQNVVEHTNKPVLVLAPLAVTQQTAREARKFDIEAHVSLDGKLRPGINIANYERLHHFSASDFAGAVCDESSILKSFDGERRSQITEFMRKIRYRLLCTATAAPNEYIELGTSSEALGYLGYMDMLSRFFKNNQGNSINPIVARRKGKSFTQLDDNAKWRFKGHAEVPFWKWVCSWARATRKPSDIGFSDDGYALPPLIERQHMVEAKSLPSGKLFALPAYGLSEQREERRRTITERCERAAELVEGHDRSLIFCHLNDEGNLLEKLIPFALQVKGADGEEYKVKASEWFQGEICICNEPLFRSKLSAWHTATSALESSGMMPTGWNGHSCICGHTSGKRRLICKPVMFGWGLNFQHCAHIVTFPTHSYEQHYQGVRRCWRFGQTRPVQVDIVTTEGEKDILSNLQRKAAAADRMFAGLIAHMNEAISVDRSLVFTNEELLPDWL